ncbi:MAG: phosphatidylglycerophosphatase A [Dysgonamonadaceae bacterium]|jgi:phosphatidylglycerophosphatase A|nr:phosphatidylglycerophosphatase A [Dysgonamonadaceae bacterium]
MEQEKKTINKDCHWFHIIISTGFGSGFCPIAPGTAGAILATIIWYVLSLFVSTEPLISSALFFSTLALTVVFTIVGTWSSGVMERYWGEDPSRVVVDEMVGVWIPLLAVGDGNIYYGLAALALFRLFDIFKPLGIRKAEDVGGGLGIMLDDIVAGVYSLIILIGVRCLIG